MSFFNAFMTIDSDSPGYPKLNQRVEIINENKARFEELNVYDSAVFCFIWDNLIMTVSSIKL